MLGSDIEMPVPEALVVEVDPSLATDLYAKIPGRVPPNPTIPAFGSKLLPSGYSTLPVGKRVPDDLRQTALEILAFDVVIQNGDRIPTNPNCLTNGQSL